MSSNSDFIGNIPHLGILKVHDTPENEFIGFIQVLQQPSPYKKEPGKLGEPGKYGTTVYGGHGMGKNYYMYFKEYTINDSGSKPVITFHNLILNDNQDKIPYKFDLAFLRIPTELTYVAVKMKRKGSKKIKKLYPYLPANQGTKIYSGLALFNIHQDNDGSIADKCHLPPNYHFDTSVNLTTFRTTSAASPDKIETNAKCGCSKPTTTGGSSDSNGKRRIEADQFVLFTKRKNSGKEYYMLGIITDNTVCYFKTRKSNVIINQIEKVLANARKTKKYGFAHNTCSRYTIREFKNKFGVHLIDDISVDKYGKPGWEIDEWKPVPLEKDPDD